MTAASGAVLDLCMSQDLGHMFAFDYTVLRFRSGFAASTASSSPDASSTILHVLFVRHPGRFLCFGAASSCACRVCRVRIFGRLMQQRALPFLLFAVHRVPCVFCRVECIARLVLQCLGFGSLSRRACFVEYRFPLFFADFYYLFFRLSEFIVFISSLVFQNWRFTQRSTTLRMWVVFQMVVICHGRLPLA